jgi:hypothetical protein
VARGTDTNIRELIEKSSVSHYIIQSASMISNVTSCEKLSCAIYFCNMQDPCVFDFILPKKR